MLEKEVMRLESSLEKGQQKLEQSTGHIWEEYQTGLSEARKYIDKELGPDSRIRQKISELRSAIKDLGPINIQAIEEFKEVSERYELTKTQHDDIMSAQNTVLEIIKEPLLTFIFKHKHFIILINCDCNIILSKILLNFSKLYI